MAGTNFSSVDAADVARFEQLGDTWWDLDGPMSALHQINPLRIGFIRDLIVEKLQNKAHAEPRSVAFPLRNVSILDIGCGAGILSEPLARLGARVTGIDPAQGNIRVAQEHADNGGLDIAYLACTAESLAAEATQFDAVLAMEVVEHVRNMPDFVKTACTLVRPGGLLIASTLNRTLKSFALAIVGAEYILGWVAKGTHQWEKFVTPDELETAISRGGLNVVDEAGLIYSPLRGQWSLGSDTSVNYMLAASRPV